MTRTLVFTGTYNERQTVEVWVRGVSQQQPDADLLVVDDSSPDGTGTILTALQDEFPRLIVYSRPGKQGLNTAHLHALRFALDEGYDRIVTMDADGSHQPRQIARLLEASDRAGFVIGTRYRGGSYHAPVARRALSLGANGASRLLLPMGISEYTTSFRVFSPDAMRAVVNAPLSFRGYAFFIECLEVVHQSGVSMAEVPIDFVDRIGGTSKIPRSQILLSVEALGRLSLRRVRRSIVR
jgi:dolichol-phosphate mannosyltransferase